MKVVYTEKEIEKMIENHLSGLAPEGKVPKIRYDRYSNDYCTVTFEDRPAEVTEDGAPELPPEDKPIDLSEIPF